MNIENIHSIPVLHTRGTHYQVGYNIGKAFGSLIKDFLDVLDDYNTVSLPLYNLPKGRQEFDNVLRICQAQFPQYVKEIEGMSDGAGLPFHKLFILHVEYLMSAGESDLEPSPRADHGCTNITVNNGTGNIVMGHTEDAYGECYGRSYIVQAEIVDEEGRRIEQFSSVCYPGFLPGYTMGFNDQGMMHSVNTINPAKRNPNGTPREFLARALLGAGKLEDVIKIIKNPGYGVADGFNIDFYFANDGETSPVVYSIEAGPALDTDNKKESVIDILQIPVGDTYFHCNRYSRLPIDNMPNFFAVSTDFRQETLSKLPKPKDINDVKAHLSDMSNKTWPVYRVGGKEDHGKTILTGIFDTSKKLWYIYTGPSATTAPTAVLSMKY